MNEAYNRNAHAYTYKTMEMWNAVKYIVVYYLNDTVKFFQFIIRAVYAARQYNIPHTYFTLPLALIFIDKQRVKRDKRRQHERIRE